MSKPLLEIDGLKTYYRTGFGDVKAVDNVSFSVRENEVFGIAGESGCGKSTLALTIARLITPPCEIVAGKILFDGIDLLNLDEEKMRQIRWKRISYIPQSAMNALNPVMCIEDQIVDAIIEHEKIPKDKATGKVPELLRSVGLSSEVAKMYPHELSGGMRQRAIIAMALALKPELIIADEPTTALDVNVQKVVLETLCEVRERLGASLILITHSMAVHAEVVDRLAIMYAGEIVEMGEVYELFERPLHPYTRGLMSSIPSIEAKKDLISIPGNPPLLLKPPSGCRFNPRCSLATDRCQKTEPIFHDSGNEHYVACHLYR